MKKTLLAVAGTLTCLLLLAVFCFSVIPGMIPRTFQMFGKAYEFQRCGNISYIINNKILATDMYYAKGKEYVILGPFPHLQRCRYLMVWDTDIFFFDDSPSVCFNNGKELILTVNINDSDERFNLSDSMCGWDARYIISRSGDMFEYKIFPSTHFPDTLSFSIPQKHFEKQK